MTSYTSAKTFVDTNIFVYSINPTDQRKFKKARELIDSLSESDTGIVSAQVLIELYNVLTRKLSIEPVTARELVFSFQNLKNFHTTNLTIQTGIDLSILYRLSIWDAMILASAKESGCAFLLSEDLQHDQVVSGVTVINPFI